MRARLSREMVAPALLGQLVIARCDDGEGEVRWGGRSAILGPGTALVQPAEAPPAVLVRTSAELRCRLVFVDPARLPAAASSGAPAVTRTPLVADGLDALFAAVERRADAMAQRGILRGLLAAALASSAEADEPPALTPPIARARATLQARYVEGVQLGELAQVAGISKCHLVHLFHKEVGLPPHAYQIHLRVARARTLVAEGVPLAEVASRTGFADQSHLTRLFKRVTGLPPGQYAALRALLPAPAEAAAGS
jgi:AraC-like DNA-binding protein